MVRLTLSMVSRALREQVGEVERFAAVDRAAVG